MHIEQLLTTNIQWRTEVCFFDHLCQCVGTRLFFGRIAVNQYAFSGLTVEYDWLPIALPCSLQMSWHGLYNLLFPTEIVCDAPSVSPGRLSTMISKSQAFCQSPSLSSNPAITHFCHSSTTLPVVYERRKTVTGKCHVFSIKPFSAATKGSRSNGCSCAGGLRGDW